jgi:hypothetical protein
MFQPSVDEYGNMTVDIEYSLGSATFTTTFGLPPQEWPDDEEGQRDAVLEAVYEDIESNLHAEWTVRSQNE